MERITVVDNFAKLLSQRYLRLSIFGMEAMHRKGAAHILGENLPKDQSRYCSHGILLQFIYKTLLLYGHQGARLFLQIWQDFAHVNPMGGHILISGTMFRPNIILFTKIRFAL